MPTITTTSKRINKTEQIIRIPLIELHPFPDHPYGIREDQAMQDTVDSVNQNGVVVPAIVRPRAEGGYGIVAGHSRKLASERASQSVQDAVRDHQAHSGLSAEGHSYNDPFTEKQQRGRSHPICCFMYYEMFSSIFLERIITLCRYFAFHFVTLLPWMSCVPE